VVHQILVDYQNKKRGGNGYLRLLQYCPGGRTLRVGDYSPVLGLWIDDPGCRFELVLDLPSQRENRAASP